MGAGFVVDNSVVMAWCFEGENDAYALRVLDSLAEGEAVVPAVWPLELGNVLVAAERRKRLDEAASTRFLALVRGLRITVEQEPPERMLTEGIALARRHGLTTHDASYLDLAMRQGLPLATLDASLRAAAKKCRVRLYAPSA